MNTACPTGKIPYPSPQRAHAVLERQTGRSRKANQRHALKYAPCRSNIYKCPMCGQWHTGHEVIR